jgi:hydrogenase expression/formation protein HypC
MCLAVPVQVVSVEGDQATVALEGNTRTANLSLVGEAAVGEWVLLHAGFAIEKISSEEAQETLGLLREVGELSLETE